LDGALRFRVAGGAWTTWLSAGAAPADVAGALNQLPLVWQVDVSDDNVNAGTQFDYLVTFVGHHATVPALEVDSSALTGTDVDVNVFFPAHEHEDDQGRLSCDTCAPNEAPTPYMSTFVPSDTYQATVSDLVPGQTYEFRVRAVNGHGPGPAVMMQATVPQLPPTAPSAVSAVPVTGTSTELDVSFVAPSSDGGAVVELYRIEWDTTPAFDSLAGGGQTTIRCPAAPVYTVWEIITSDSSNAVDDGTFTLDVTRGGITVETLPIRFDAVPTRDSELDQGDASLSDSIFCTNPGTSSGGSDDCPNNPGSVQSHLEALGFGEVVSVTRESVGNGLAWQVTFTNDFDDWHVAVNDNSVTASSNAAGVTATKLVQGRSVASLNCSPPQRLTGLVQGTPYYIRVTAMNKIGFGPSALLIGTAAPQIQPGRPTAAALTVVSGSALRVSFGPPVDNGGALITRYIVEYATDSVFSSPESVEFSQLNGGGPFAVTITGLSNGNEYWVRVSAVNAQGSGEPQVTTPPSETPRQLPAAPTNVQVGRTSASMLTVGWSAPLDAGGDEVTSYRVQWDTAPQMNSISAWPHKGSALVDPADASSFTITDLDAGTTYYVQVQAGNSVGFGPAGLPTPRFASPALQPPGMPSSVSVSSAVGPANSLTVEIDAPRVPFHGIFCDGGGTSSTAPGLCPANMGRGVEADGGSAVSRYIIQISQSSDFVAGCGLVECFFELAVSDVDVAPHSLQITGLDSTFEYFVRVAAQNSVGISEYCNRAGLLCDSVSQLSATPAAP
jgi:hypothetical protein